MSADVTNFSVWVRDRAHLYVCVCERDASFLLAYISVINFSAGGIEKSSLVDKIASSSQGHRMFMDPSCGQISG